MLNDISDIRPVVALKFQIETYIQVCLTNLKLKNLSVSHKARKTKSKAGQINIEVGKRSQERTLGKSKAKCGP